MIVKCEKCESKFNLDENLLKKDGTKVRCSVCRNIFRVFPKAPVVTEAPEEDDFSNTAMEETVALDLPPEMDGLESDAFEEEKEYSFDKAFENAMEEVIEEEGLTESDEEFINAIEEDSSESSIDETDQEDEEEVSSETVKKGKGRSKVLLFSLLAVLFVIIIFLVIFFFFPGLIPDSIYSRPAETKQTQTDPGTAQLNFKGVAGSFFKSDKAGDIFIIKGSVINNDSKSRSYILLKGGILDKEGKPIKEETAYAGNNLTDDQLKQISKEEIKSAMQNRSGVDNSNVDVKPGATIPFMIIFADLPDKGNMVDLTVEAVSSSTTK